MSTFILPNWIIKEIDKIQIRFLWHGHKKGTMERYISPITWEMITKLKYMGGMGVKDLKYMNQALMTKHIWNWITKQTALHILYVLPPHRRPWMQHNPTHFWKGIQILEPIMANSIKFQVKDGLMIRFWLDNWSEGCLVHNFRLLSTFTPDITTSFHEIK
jgi:hypothetical protein